MTDIFGDNPKKQSQETLMRKFLPYNGGDDDVEDPYASDHFRMYEFKVRRCTRSRSHDWTDCPFAHPGEKARRRDPRRYHYSGTVCPEFRRGSCGRGDKCEFAHGVFECWLHPARYRTEACKDGKNCKRKVCFFAHSPRELRVLPSHLLNDSSEMPPVAGDRQVCKLCHPVSSSPTSTLMGLSHLSPPLSPESSPLLNGFSRFNNDHYRDVIIDLMGSLEAMNLHGEDPNQFLFSPNSAASDCFKYKDYSTRDGFTDGFFEEEEKPDLGWVNELLM